MDVLLMTALRDVGIVVIGRNEGQRLVACIASLPSDIPCVYVDSGSSDGSCEHARERGLVVVDLDMSISFTAARARNAGYRRLVLDHPDICFVQFIDGDCVLDPQWLPQARQAMDVETDLAIVFGRRRERFPEASLYNAQCDQEWNVPVGEAPACGGDALVRRCAFEAVGGYAETLIAGEEPDLCLRLRRKGWRIRRIDVEMTLHDADIHKFGIWWRRNMRAGHAYAEHLWRHRGLAIPDWTRAFVRMMVWAAILPMVALISAVGVAIGFPSLFGLLAVLVLLLFGVRFARIVFRSLRHGENWQFAIGNAWLLSLDKFAQLAGAAKFGYRLFARKPSQLIEYK